MWHHMSDVVYRAWPQWLALSGHLHIAHWACDYHLTDLREHLFFTADHPVPLLHRKVNWCKILDLMTSIIMGFVLCMTLLIWWPLDCSKSVINDYGWAIFLCQQWLYCLVVSSMLGIFDKIRTVVLLAMQAARGRGQKAMQETKKKVRQRSRHTKVEEETDESRQTEWVKGRLQSAKREHTVWYVRTQRDRRIGRSTCSGGHSYEE